MDSHQVQVLPSIWIAKQPEIIWASASCGMVRHAGTLDRIRIAFIINAIGEKRASETPYDPK